MTTTSQMFDENGQAINAEVLPDKGVMHIRMNMMDAQSVPPAQTPMVAFPGHRPGTYVADADLSDKALKKKASAFQLRCDRLENAWRGTDAKRAAEQSAAPLVADAEGAHALYVARIAKAWKGPQP